MMPEIVLNSGRSMPVIGMGTATYPVPPEDEVVSAALDAIELGYRHFDTASLYQSERPLGCAIAIALDRGLIRSHQELFITTKLWCTDTHPDRVEPALRESLRALGLDYVDLFLIHYPVRLAGQERSMVFSIDDVIAADIRGVWEAMERCHEMGLARSIGVSNFTCKKLVDLLAHAKIPPAVNQVEMHPLWQQRKLRELCSEKGIYVTAYSPLGGPGHVWGTNDVIEAEQIKEIARSRGKSPAQVCLRWAAEQGVSFVPRSFNKDWLKENMEIFDWELSKEEAEKLSNLPQRRMVNAAPAFVSPNGLFKSNAEFWDGEV